jgi:hypothetical protein
MEIVLFPFRRGVLLSVVLEDGRRAYWSESLKCCTTSYDEATSFETDAAASTALGSGRKKMEAAFLKRTGIDLPVQDG